MKMEVVRSSETFPGLPFSDDRLSLFIVTAQRTPNPKKVHRFKSSVVCRPSIQGVPGGKVNILRGHSIGHSN
jgi:hypothetical protein